VFKPIIAILGLGLLGGSIAIVARKKGISSRVIGWSHRESTRLTALETGVIDECHPTPQEAVAKADFVILCTPVGAMPALLEMIAPALKRGAIVTDVGSTKRSVVAAAERILNVANPFIGSHPMAGSERSGIGAADEKLFDDRLCILAPNERTDPNILVEVTEFWHDLGMRTTQLSPGEHDRLLADVSHLPHLLAAAMVSIQEERAIGVAGPGFKDSTRIAAGDAALWRDIFLDNKEGVIRSLDRFMASLKDYRTALQAGDGNRIESLLAAASERRKKM
jgi:prephenate dehydrogenase